MLDELENSKVGVKLKSGEMISVLAYADDILLLAESSEDLQRLSDIINLPMESKVANDSQS